MGVAVVKMALPVCLLEGQDACVGRDQRAVESGRAVHVLRRVLQVALSLVLIYRGVDWDRLQGGREGGRKVVGK